MSEFKELAEFYNIIYQNKPYKAEAQRVLDWIGYKPKTILDLGCGTGQHAKYWADKGIKVIGVDQSKEMLRFVPKHKNIIRWNSGIQAFISPSVPIYSVVTALFNVMGYADLKRVIQYINIRKGGYFIFDIWDLAKVRAYPPQVKVEKFCDFSRVTIPEILPNWGYRDGDLDSKILHIQYNFVHMDELIAREDHYVRAYNLNTVFNWARKSGFEVERTKPYSREGDWPIWFMLKKR